MNICDTRKAVSQNDRHDLTVNYRLKTVRSAHSFRHNSNLNCCFQKPVPFAAKPNGCHMIHVPVSY